MRRLTTMTMLALLLAAPAGASLAVLLATDDRVIAASDSRQWDTRCDCPYHDEAAKILTRAPYAVAVTHDPAPLSAAASLPLVPGESAAALATRIINAVPHGDIASESTIAVVRFGGDAIVRHVKFWPDGRTETIREAHPPLPAALLLGWEFAPDAEMAALVRRLTAELRSGPSEARMIAMAETTLRTGASRSPKIGGRTHISVLDHEGVRQPTPSGGPLAWSGTGFWLDATSTPTFRVGNPSGDLLKWDGTDVTVVSGTVSIDQNGIKVTPHTTINSWSESSAFRFPVTSGSLGMIGAANSNERQLALYATSAASGVENLSIYLQTSCGICATTSSASILANAQNADATISLTTIVDEVNYAGYINVGGVPNFLGAVSGTAGAVAGYIDVLVGGTSYRIAVYAP